MHASTETLWHYTDGTSTFGPLSTTVIRQLIDTGVIAPGFHLCRDGDEAWTPLANVNFDTAPRPILPPTVPPPPGPATKAKNPIQRYYIDVWKKYAVFSGRASRTEFWFFNLFSFIALNVLGLLEGGSVGIGHLVSWYVTAFLCPPIIVLGMFMCFFMGGVSGVMQAYHIGLLSLLYGLAVFIPSVAVAVRRINDSAHSIWWLLVPFAAPIFGLAKGSLGPNRHGPDPSPIEG